MKQITILSDIIVKCCDDCPFFNRQRRCELTPGRSVGWEHNTSVPDNFPFFCELKSGSIYRKINEVKDGFGR